jgi:hypothetical protein
VPNYTAPTTDSHQPESAPAPGETYADGWLSHTAFQLADLIAGACAAVAELQCGDEIPSGETELENKRDHSRLLTSIETARRLLSRGLVIRPEHCAARPCTGG